MDALLAFLLLCSSAAHAPVQEVRCDLVEVNHYMAWDELHHQLIGWEWHQYDQQNAGYRVCWFRSLKDEAPAVVKDARGYTIFSQSSIFYGLIRAKHFRETWTNWDPEAADASKFPRDLRMGWPRPEELPQ